MHAQSSVHVYDYELVSQEAFSERLQVLTLYCPDLAQQLVPGQFMNFEVPYNAAHITRVPLSFSRTDADAGTIEVVYAKVGEGTQALARLAAHEHATVVGPCGKGWALGENQRVLAVSGGVGAPPVIAAARACVQAGCTVDVILGARSAADLWGEADAHELGARDVYVTTDDGSYGQQGFTTEAMKVLLSKKNYDMVYTCGPTPMMAGVAALCEQHAIGCQASLERMMTCGFGACSTCNVALRTGGYKSCCMDGPVFNAQEVLW